MTEMNDNEIKSTLVGILAQFDKICKDNNLRYSLDAGSLLGAVRHKGIIPWDDDIDVMMLREDYEKLLSLKYEDESFVIKSYRYSDNYYYIFSKMMDKRTHIDELGRPEKDSGIYIDIFPYDYVDDNEESQKRLAAVPKIKRFVLKLTSDTKYKAPEVSLPRYILKRIVRLVTDPFRKKILYKIDTMNIRDKGEYCNKFIFGDETRLMPASLFEEYESVEFENIKAMAIKDYDTFLTIHYGDYMTPPPPEQQLTHHSFKAYRKC